MFDLYFDRRGNDLATRVVYESVFNAARHSAADFGFITSQLLKVRSGPNRGLPYAVEIAVWDSGENYATTLGQRLADQLPIVSSAFGKEVEEFVVEVETELGPRDQPITLESSNSDFGASRAALTAAAFMHGVTSRPEDVSDDDDEDASPPPRSDPGTGLYYVRRIVIDRWKGKLRYASGVDRVSVTGDGLRGHYRARVSQRPDQVPPIAGNLLIATIPVRTGVAAGQANE